LPEDMHVPTVQQVKAAVGEYDNLAGLSGLVGDRGELC
jgi:hypothetical protein